MARWTAFTYRDFHDVPRMVLVSLQSGKLLLVSRFNERLDDYEPTYRTFLLREDADVSGSWESIESLAVQALGTVGVQRVRFDDRRRSRIDLESLGFSVPDCGLRTAPRPRSLDHSRMNQPMAA